MTTNEIRKKYLEYFKQKQHEVISSASLLPENDPTTLFTGSGMQPLIPYLLGEEHPKGTRLVNSQKCFRSQDIEEVGDNRHTTFFEMLGNWSLGEYFKEEQISWIFDFLINEVGLNPDKIYITCYSGNEDFDIPKDEVAAELWQRLFKEKGIEAEIVDIGSEATGYARGMKKGERIFYYDGTKNWWSRGGSEVNTPVGDPCGPDSEMFYDFGTPHDPSFGEHCHPNCDCGRFMEIGNNVFMAYRKVDEKTFVPLEKPNIDHGSGFERIAAAQIDSPDVFQIGVFEEMRNALEDLSGKTYGDNEKETFAFRVIMDHIRAATFLIADGAFPSNKDQGYFTRRLIRRAVRYSNIMGIEEDIGVTMAASVLDTYKDAYPELDEKREEILAQMQKEEQKFKRTIEKGMKQFEEIVYNMGDDRTIMSGTEAFDLYQSYGFPIELTEELADERGLSIDCDGFEKEKKYHQELSRKGAEKKFKGGLSDHSDMSVKYHTATHLLHIALRRVLGEHVEQKGSNITPKRLRFDFSHPEKLTDEQKQEVENLVNAAIQRDYAVSWQEMPVKEAYEQNVIGFFPDRYDDVVKVYTVGEPEYPGHANPEEPTFSREICGGPHVERTGELGKFKITKEQSCSAGVRRIKAILE